MKAPTLDPEFLEELCRMARLRPDQRQAAELQRRLQDVVQTFATLAAVDTRAAAGDTATTSALPLRPDKVATIEEQLRSALTNAPTLLGDSFLVPRVVDG